MRRFRACMAGLGTVGMLAVGAGGAAAAPSPVSPSAGLSGSGSHIAQMGGNRIVDGSFEVPVVAPHTFVDLSAGQAIGPWKVTSGTVDLIGAEFFQSADGVQSVDLDGNTEGAIAQTFGTIPGTSYSVSYALAGNPQGPPTVKTGEVLVNGHVAQTFRFDDTGRSVTNMGWVVKHTVFLATTRTTTLAFASTTPGSFGPTVDAVRVHRCLLLRCALR